MSQKEHIILFGASRGLGREIAKLFLKKDSYSISIVSRSEPRADLKLAGVSYFQADLSNPDCLDGLMEKIVEKQGSPHHIIISPRYRGEDPWNGEWSMSVDCSRRIIEASCDSFVKEGDKSYVIIASLLGAYCMQGQTPAYHCAKAAAIMLCKHLSKPLGEKGIRINSVSSGAYIKEEAEEYFNANPQASEKWAGASVLGRMAHASDVAGPVYLLTQPEAKYITGHDLVVDGGISCHIPVD